MKLFLFDILAFGFAVTCNISGLDIKVATFTLDSIPAYLISAAFECAIQCLQAGDECYGYDIEEGCCRLLWCDASIFNIKVKTTIKDKQMSEIDCKSWYDHGYTADGIYTIQPICTLPLPAYCDMTQDGGGWTVFQQRADNTTDFYRSYDDYTNGFGDLNGNFWAGLEHMHYLTVGRDSELHIFMDSFDNLSYFGRYSSFSVGDAASNYELFADGFSGNTGDPITSAGYQYSVGRGFTTKDKDNDLHDGNCAVIFNGAWWYNSCHHINPNGQYFGGDQVSLADGINWYTARGFYYSMKTSILKLRRID